MSARKAILGVGSSDSGPAMTPRRDGMSFLGSPTSPSRPARNSAVRYSSPLGSGWAWRNRRVPRRTSAIESM